MSERITADLGGIRWTKPDKGGQARIRADRRIRAD